MHLQLFCNKLFCQNSFTFKNSKKFEKRTNRKMFEDVKFENKLAGYTSFDARGSNFVDNKAFRGPKHRARSEYLSPLTLTASNPYLSVSRSAGLTRSKRSGVKSYNCYGSFVFISSCVQQQL